MTAATYAQSDESRAVAALLRVAERYPYGEHRADPATATDLDDEDLIGLLIASEHGIDATRISAYKSLARSRGLSLAEVLRACFRGELHMVVALPVAEHRRRSA
ncbi:MAG: hypothetical protein ACR2FL_09565 [Nocardioidaceae bacterium]